MYIRHILFYLGLIIAGCSPSIQTGEIRTKCLLGERYRELVHHSYNGSKPNDHGTAEAGIRDFCSAMGRQDYHGYWRAHQSHRCYLFKHEHDSRIGSGYTMHILVRSRLLETFRISTQRCLNAMCKLLADCPAIGGKVDYGGHWQMEISANMSSGGNCVPVKSWPPKEVKPLEHCWDPISGHEPESLGSQVPLVQQGPNVCLTSQCITEDKL